MIRTQPHHALHRPAEVTAEPPDRSALAAALAGKDKPKNWLEVAGNAMAGANFSAWHQSRACLRGLARPPASMRPRCPR